MLKISLVVTLALASFSASAAVTKEIWTCKNSKNSSPAYLNVTVDRKASKTSGSIEDGMASGRDLDLSQDKDNREASDSLYALTGSYDSYDHSYYRVELVPSLGADEGLEGKTQAKGTAVVFSDIQIDCLGESKSVDTLDCTIEIENQP